jgi:hypothetical protein
MKRKLFAYLRKNGWSIRKSGGVHVCTKDNNSHKLQLVDGNIGADIISDWSFFADDHDGFNALLDKFLNDND